MRTAFRLAIIVLFSGIFASAALAAPFSLPVKGPLPDFIKPVVRLSGSVEVTSSTNLSLFKYSVLTHDERSPIKNITVTIFNQANIKVHESYKTYPLSKLLSQNYQNAVTLPVGKYTVQATVNDTAKNTGSASISLESDRVAPIVTLTGSIAYQPGTDDQALLTYSVEATDQSPLVSLDIIIIDHARALIMFKQTIPATNNEKTKKYTGTRAVPLGRYTIKATATDKAGNTGNATPITLALGGRLTALASVGFDPGELYAPTLSGSGTNNPYESNYATAYEFKAFGEPILIKGAKLALDNVAFNRDIKGISLNFFENQTMVSVPAKFIQGEWVWPEGSLNLLVPKGASRSASLVFGVNAHAEGARSGDRSRLALKKSVGQFSNTGVFSDDFIALGQASGVPVTSIAALDADLRTHDIMHSFVNLFNACDNTFGVPPACATPIAVEQSTSTVTAVYKVRVDTNEPSPAFNPTLKSVSLKLSGSAIGTGVGDNTARVTIRYNGIVLGQGTITDLDNGSSNMSVVTLNPNFAIAPRATATDPLKNLTIEVDTTDNDFTPGAGRLLQPQIVSFVWNDTARDINDWYAPEPDAPRELLLPVDRTPPSVTLTGFVDTNPPLGFPASNSYFRYTVHAIDARSPITRVEVKIYNEAGVVISGVATTRPGTSLEETVPFGGSLPPGKYRFVAYATDNAGNTGISSDFWLETPTPTVNVVALRACEVYIGCGPDGWRGTISASANIGEFVFTAQGPSAATATLTSVTLRLSGTYFPANVGDGNLFIKARYNGRVVGTGTFTALDPRWKNEVKINFFENIPLTVDGASALLTFEVNTADDDFVLTNERTFLTLAVQDYQWTDARGQYTAARNTNVPLVNEMVWFFLDPPPMAQNRLVVGQFSYWGHKVVLPIGSRDNSVLMVSLRNEGSEEIGVNELRFNFTGNIRSEDIAAVRLYDGPELLDVRYLLDTTRLSCSATSTDCSATFYPSNLRVAPGTTRLLFIDVDVAAGGVARLDDWFTTNLSPVGRRATALNSGSSAAIVGETNSPDGFHIVPFIVRITGESPSAGSSVTQTVLSNTWIGRFKVTNTGDAPMSLTTFDLLNYGNYTGSSTTFKLYYSDENTNFAGNTAASNSSLLFNFNPVTINGGSYRYLNIAIDRVGALQSGDSFSLGLKNAAYSVSDANLGYDGNLNGTMTDGVNNLLHEGWPILGTVVKA